MRSLLTGIAVLGVACSHVNPVAPVASPAEKHEVDVIAAALPSVVLLVATRADGTTNYGAGLIVSADGKVLTNLHVVKEAKTLQSLRYSPEFVSYTPMDGGLERFLFEHKHFLTRASVIRSDEESDLSLVQIDSDTSNVKLLAFAKAAPQQGERVIALGHPRETVWSFSAGMVSALHLGAIQHDAAINPGSSGGPLLNAKAEILGINTSRLFGDSNGVAFARPIHIAAALLNDSQQAFPVDLSSLERAVTSCFRAEEMGAETVVDCIDWHSRWQFAVAAAEIIDSILGSGRATQLLASEGGEHAWVTRMKLEFHQSQRQHRKPRPLDADVNFAPAVDSLVKQNQKVIAQRTERIVRETGLKPDIRDRRAVRQVLHRGLRIEAIEPVTPTLSWVLIVGRNLDGSEYRVSEAWEKGATGWHQHFVPSAADLALRPKRFAPALLAPAEELAAQQLLLLERLYGPVGGAELHSVDEDPAVMPVRRPSGSNGTSAVMAP